MKLGTASPIAVTAFMFAAVIAPRSIAGAAEPGPRVIKTVAGMPPVVDPNNLYSERPPSIKGSSFIVVDNISENRFHRREDGR